MIPVGKNAAQARHDRLTIARVCPFCGQQPLLSFAVDLPPQPGRGRPRQLGCDNRQCWARPRVQAPDRARALQRWNTRLAELDERSDWLRSVVQGAVDAFRVDLQAGIVDLDGWESHLEEHVCRQAGVDISQIADALGILGNVVAGKAVQP